MSCKLLAHILLDSTVRFAPLRDALDLGSRMRPVIWLFIFKDLFQNRAGVVTSKLPYTTVRLALSGAPSIWQRACVLLYGYMVLRPPLLIKHFEVDVPTVRDFRIHFFFTVPFKVFMTFMTRVLVAVVIAAFMVAIASFLTRPLLPKM